MSDNEQICNVQHWMNKKLNPVTFLYCYMKLQVSVLMLKRLEHTDMLVFLIMCENETVQKIFFNLTIETATHLTGIFREKSDTLMLQQILMSVFLCV